MLRRWYKGFRVWGLGFRVQGLGFRVEGSRLRKELQGSPSPQVPLCNSKEGQKSK